MDIATRFQPRARAQSYLDREGNPVPDDSGTESESLVRRKFQRTASNSNAPDESFRKPSLPASATRQPAEQRTGFTHHRRRSTLRDAVRVPSGPREFPSPGKRSGGGSINSLTPSAAESTQSTRSFLQSNTSEPFFSKTGEATHFTFGNPPSSDDFESPLTPAGQGEDFGFIPTVNFDDLQNSIANYDGNGPLLSDFPMTESERPTRKETGSRVVRDMSLSALHDSHFDQEPTREDHSITKSQSFRRRFTSMAGNEKQASDTSDTRDGDSATGTMGSTSLRTRRQSTVPSGLPPPGPAPPPLGAGTRPRKSLGPGVITSMMEGRKISQPLPSTGLNSTSKNGLNRTNSLNKASRRTTMHPPASGGSDFSRQSTLTATTQSRASKVKSLQPPPRDADPNTPHTRSVSKVNQNRAHTPSSSGNKRQSTVSGRASGLGARTISPTDARRLKRLSMMQAPPVPGNPLKAKTPTPQEEILPAKLEFPRLAQPSPSLIPRKASTATPTSARASPEGRPSNGNNAGGHTLSAKSSYQSLLAASVSTSRLPTLKPRNVHSSSAQYAEDEEMVPPVPAIPKAYESPRETDFQFFSGPLKSSQAGPSEASSIQSYGGDVPLLQNTPKSSMDLPSEARRKLAADQSRAHQRMNTIENIERSVNMSAPKSSRIQPDATGRKNNNLQPLRLPPLNLMPITQSKATRSSHLPRPSQELDASEDYSSAQTPEPKRVAKTPSTPMTASKATFFRRQDEDLSKQQAMRSSSSHFALRDLMQLDNGTTQFFDDNDMDFMNVGLPIPSSKPRSAITPFSSGSLPKGSGEFVRQLARPSLDYKDDFPWPNFENAHQSVKPQGPRPSRSGTKEPSKATDTTLRDSPPVEPHTADPKKEVGGIRRKLSINWRRSGSKTGNHVEHKSSPPQEGLAYEKEKSKAQKRASQMLPPELPASATWTGDIPSLPAPAVRPSLDSVRRKSTAPSVAAMLSGAAPEQPNTTKSTVQSAEQSTGLVNRASSWGNVNSGLRPPSTRPPNAPKPRHVSSASAASIFPKEKDKDDLAADEEMRRLSQKRRDVDTAAKESEELRKRAVVRSPMSPERALHDRSCNLNIFERGEVMDYEKDGVYFTGTKTARKIIGSLTTSPQPTSDKDPKASNYGYDDERGDYNIVLGDHLAYRYEVVDVLGKGSFGQVVRCVDHKDGGVVAVKIIRNKKRFHQQALVEVGILGRLREWDPNGAHATLSITSSFYFRSHLCIVTPCLSINLYELIRAHNFVGFSLPLIRRFARQLLSCLVLLQDKHIIHCDLKPENILLCEARKADVRVIDFGSSCKEEEKVYTYIQSRFYRSPEVILGSSYGLGIDMWSLGCILAELWTGYPLFPGENEQEQLACIMEIFGPPDRHLVERCTRKKLFFDSVGKPRVTVSSKGRRRRPSSKTLSQALKIEDEAFLDFVSRCLRWDPDRRMKPHDAVNHAFITNQPLNQRPKIPDEARRAARLRSTAAVPTTNGNIPSPIKRVHTTSGVHTSPGNAFAQQAQQTPARDKTRPLPETPQTALRTGVPSGNNHNNNNNNNQVSPSKQLGISRRTSTATATTANAVAVTGSKRASNGAPVGTAVIGGSGATQQRQGSNNSAGSLAQMAAREANAARWRA